MNRLIFAASESDADMLYATRFLAPDPFLYFEKAGRSFVALSQLEYDRGRKEAKVDRVFNQSEFARGLRARGRPAPHDWIAALLIQHRIRCVTVSPSFSLSLARTLERRGIRVRVAENGLFPERECKTRGEIATLRHSLRATAEIMRRAIELIHRARARRDGVLMLAGAPLTSERLQTEIRMEAGRRGFEASHPIAAGGVQACDPHARGHGPLKSGELIILDIFPRDLSTGYWGDMTRTVVKGRASDAQRRQFHAVRQAQKLAMFRLRNGVDGRTVHAAVNEFFESKGYRTGNFSGRYEGFFHGTGHGLGLEIHEAPRVSSVPHTLRTGNVVTVEPGLYYPSVGGVRIEDVVVIRRGGCEKLSHFPVRLEI